MRKNKYIKIMAIPLLTVAIIFLSLAALIASAAPDLPDGNTGITLRDGDLDGSYEISSAEELVAFSNLVNGGNTQLSASLTSDIDLSGVDSFTPIGNSSNKYKGVFDGRGYTVSNLKITVDGEGDFGLFGYVTGNTAVIKDLFVNGEVKTALKNNANVRYGVIGQADGGALISDVHSTVNFASGDAYLKKYIGGIVGQAGNLTVEGCSFGGTLDLSDNDIDCVGGIVAYVYNGKTVNIESCGYYGEIKAEKDGNVGGILGYYNGENGKNLTLSGSLSAGVLPTDAGAFIGTVKNYGASAIGDGNFKLDSLINTASGVASVDFTAEQLSSGEAAYLMNGSTSEGELLWGQTLDGDYPDKCPTPFGKRVYYGYRSCKSTEKEYSSSPMQENTDHSYTNGFCTGGDYEIPLGDGTEESPYLIDNGGKLYWFMNELNAKEGQISARLTADITVNERVLDDEGGLIGNVDSLRPWPLSKKNVYYQGTFDGNGKKISGIYADYENENEIALFRFLGENGLVKDLGIEDSYFNGSLYVGAFSGINYGKISGCYNKGYVGDGSPDTVGGIVGYNYLGAVIENCYNEGNVSGETNVGGITGFNVSTVKECYNLGEIRATLSGGGITGINSENVNDCYNKGDVFGVNLETRKSNEIGGIAGSNTDNGVVSNSYNEAEISGYAGVGGIIGSNFSRVDNCYNKGSVTGSDLIGGVMGFNKHLVTYSYNEGDVNGEYCVGGIIGENSGGTVRGVYNHGKITASGKYVGGITGMNDGGGITVAFNSGAVDGTDKNIGAIDGAGGGSFIVCFYLKVGSDSEAIFGANGKDKEGIMPISASEFASGKITYLLNLETDMSPFKQTLGLDAYPSFSGDAVYPVFTGCGSDDVTFTNNSEESNSRPAHTPSEDDGNCTTEVRCEICNEVTLPASESHTGGTADCNSPAKCETCGTEYGEVLEHIDEDRDHVCDFGCGKRDLNMDKHIDEDSDHACDYGCETEIGEHSDGEDKDHACDYGCGEIADDGCYDTLIDGICDECGNEIAHECKGGSATCKELAKCSICGKEYGELAKHKPNEDDGDCTTALTCSVCEKVVTEAKSAHVFGDPSPEDGTWHTRVCECGTEEREKHSFGEWSVVKEATEDEEGSLLRSCACGHSETKTVPKTGGIVDDPIDPNTPENTPEDTDPNQDQGGLSGGEIAAIVIGGVATLSGVGAALYIFVFKKKR